MKIAVRGDFEILAREVGVRENAPVTSADLDELIALAEETSAAAERAGAVSRVRSVDIQLTTVREKTAALVQKARGLTLEES